ncbi:hypothetical protein BCR33DRAFT_716770 [Rhizoclosmatium globosum]|uniref:Uncharacterized protein n=1 Tax=Rhizoclosmatium globosum TaxID=329046 RepID=A0A1Y2CCN9_9FUNG|nr:hypothetical protein BCR33DRAFT_716770 [Rhizoclosmatium globosum]|eukprot:ORY44821.1 hypothetical protein BCR33DRAFT_716770 [Rhizoclosmatium globosum]
MLTRRDSTSETGQLVFGGLVLICVACALGYVIITFLRNRTDKQTKVAGEIQGQEIKPFVFPGAYIPV